MDEHRSRIHDDLRGVLDGDLFVDPLHRALYASDASLFQIQPLAVVRPRHTGDVVALAAYAAENRIPLIARGAGTGLAGESLGAGIVVDFSRYMRRIVETTEDGVRVEPGVVCDRLNRHLATRGRMFPPDPAGSSCTTVGSMVAINAAGSHSLRYGTTRDYVERLQIVLAGGAVIEVGREPTSGRADGPPEKRELVRQFAALLRSRADLIERKQPRSRRNRSGYLLAGTLKGDSLDLPRLLVGSEGTLAIVTEITLRTSPLPRFRGVTLLLFSRLADASRAVQEILPFDPSACDLLDRRLLSLARDADPQFRALIPFGAEAALIVEKEGTNGREVRDRVREIVEHLQRKKRLAFASRQAFEPARIALIWSLPRTVVPLLYRLKGSARPVPFVEDVAAPTEVLPSFLVDVQNIFKRHEVTASLFAHAGDGQLHWRPFLNLADARDRGKVERLATDLYQAVLAVGGTISGEHGDGLARTPFIRRQYGELYDVFREVKRIFDPYNLLNPGKIISDDPHLLTKNLRYNGQAQRAADLHLELAWDAAQVRETAARCNGCGACRTQALPQRMCPIFRAEPAEEASPRAKANLMRHIVEGTLDPGLLEADELKQVADLCVNCKMCRLDCPAGVDIPKLMTEAKGSYVAVNGLRWGDWVLSRVDLLAALGSLTGAASNWALGNGVCRWALEQLLGISRFRKLPRFVGQPFLRWAARHRLNRPPVERQRRVAYFVDTYANYCDPALGRALVSLLRHHGVGVYVPPGQSASGMPLITAGDLDAARPVARGNVRLLAELVREGYHVVCTEPAAAVCLVEEYPNLLDDPDAHLVAQHTSEACDYLWQMHLEGELDEHFQPLPVAVGCHTPCQLKALQAGTPGQQLLRLIPQMRVHTIERGCCGMAGTFGMKRENFRTSLRAGWPLLAYLRDAQLDYGATECSTCRMQMEQAASTPTVHPIKMLAHACGLQVVPELAGRAEAGRSRL